MQLVNLKTGKPDEVGEDELLPALAAGSHAPVGAKALINPDGELVFSPMEDVHANLAQYGYSIPTQTQLNELSNQKQYGEGVGNVAKAALEGVSRGTTFGLSDLAESKLGISTPEAIRERRERNPVASTAGEIGGAVGSALLAPELSPAGILSKAGAGVAERLAPEALGEGASLAAKALNAAGQVGARAAGSAIEGAAYGMGQTVSEAALGDPNLNAEKIMANIGYGGFFGGALGGLLKAGEMAVPAGLEKAQSAVKNAYETLVGKVGEEGEFEAGPLMKGIAKGGEFATGEPEQEILDYAKRMKEGEILTPDQYQKYRKDFRTSLQDTYDNLNKSTLEASTKVRPQEIGELSQGLDPAATGAELQGVGQKLNIVMSEIENNPDAYTTSVGKSLGRMKTTLDKALEDQIAPSGGEMYQVPKTAADHYLALNDLKKRLYEVQQNLKGGSFTDKESLGLVNELYSTVQESLKNSDVWGETAGRQEAYNAAIKDQLAAKEQFEQEFMSKKKIGGRPVWRMNERKVSEFFNMINDDRSEAKKEALTNFFKTSRNTVDELDKTYQSAVFEKFDKQGLSDLINKNEQMANDAQDIVSDQPNMGYGGLKNLAHSLMQGQGPQSLFGLAAKAISDPYAAVNRLGNLERAAQKSSDAISTATKSVFKPGSELLGKFVGPAAGKMTEEAQRKEFDQRAQKVDQYNNAPAKAIDHLELATRDMYHVAPNIGSAMQVSAIRGTQFLSSKVPRSPYQMLPLDKPFKPSIPQMIKFNRYYQTVHRPLSALSELKSGFVQPETIETLQTVYPSLYNEMKTELIGHLSTAMGKEEPVSYQKRMAISTFIGSPVDSSLVPANIQMNQAMLNQQSAQKSAQESDQMKSTSKGIGNIGLAGRLKTSIQDSAQRERA